MCNFYYLINIIIRTKYGLTKHPILKPFVSINDAQSAAPVNFFN